MKPLLFVLIALLPHAACHAELFKCKQADGKVSFQDQPCPPSSTGGRLSVSVASPSGDAPPPPGAANRRMPGMREAELRHAELDARKAEADARASREQAEAYNRSVRCNEARHNLGTLKVEKPVFRYDNNGDRMYLADADRDAARADARRAVAENCR